MPAVPVPAPRAGDLPRVLVVADKFPPELGGIQTFACHLTMGLPPERVVVVAPPAPGDAAFDRTLPFPVIRTANGILTSSRSRRLLRSVARAEGCEVAWFPTAAPLGLLAPSLRKAGVGRVVASSHGHEVAWSRLPGGRSLVRSVGSRVDVLTFLTEFTRRRLASVVPAGTRLTRLTGGVDAERFRPGAGGEQVRADLGWSDRPVVICVARLVARKGQDALIRGWPAVLRRQPHARLVIIGAGPAGNRLRGLAARSGVADSVWFAGAVPDRELPAYLDAADVFAMPSRTRLFGLDLEGLGLSALEAAASGLPVITGAQGGAPDVVLPGRSGLVVDGHDSVAVATAVADLLDDPERRVRMGLVGRDWMRQAWDWQQLSRRLGDLLGGREPVDADLDADLVDEAGREFLGEDPAMRSAAPSGGTWPGYDS